MAVPVRLAAGLGLVVLVLFWRSARPAPTPRVAHATASEVLRLFRARAAMWAISPRSVRPARGPRFGIAFWLPSFIVEDEGLSLRTAGIVVGIGAALTAPSNFLGGYIADRLRHPFSSSASLAMLALTLVLLVQVDSVPLLLLVVVLLLFSSSFYFGPLFAVPMDMLVSRMAGLSSGFGNFFANIGRFTFVYAIGAMEDATGSVRGLVSTPSPCGGRRRPPLPLTLYSAPETTSGRPAPRPPDHAPASVQCAPSEIARRAPVGSVEQSD